MIEPPARTRASPRVPPIKLTLEQTLEFIADEELVEVTQKSIRLHKKVLSENDRNRFERSKVLLLWVEIKIHR